MRMVTPLNGILVGSPPTGFFMIWGKRTDYTHGIVASGVSFLLPTVLSVVLCVSVI